MITDIPTKVDFDNNGVAFLNLAWESILAISLNLPAPPSEPIKEAAEPEDGEDGEDGHPDAGEEVGGSVPERTDEDQKRWLEAIEHYPHLPRMAQKRSQAERRWSQAVDEYLRAAQQALGTAVALAQQGTEFLLKGKIAAVSPLLLISGDPRDWPAGCDKNDVPFADFKTIDAQDLIRCHDTVCSPRLSDQFKNRFEQLRRMRNSVMHTVDTRLRFTTKEGLLAILEMVEALIGENVWLGLRKQHLKKKPNFPPSGIDRSRCQMALEAVHVIALLQPAQVKKFFSFEKRQRRYLCPECEGECASLKIGVTLAQLQPNTPESTTVFCIVCSQTHQVARTNCGKIGCRGNVVSVHNSFCLTCGAARPEGEAQVHEGIGLEEVFGGDIAEGAKVVNLSDIPIRPKQQPGEQKE
jgi:hypothetical protein